MKTTFLITLSFALLPILGCEAGNDQESTINSENKVEVTKTGNGSEVKTGEVIHLTKAEFLEKIMDYEKNPNEWVFEGDKPCVIDFYADWCRPCKIAGPVLEELAKEYNGKINVYKIDTQVERELAGVFGIQSIPAFLWCPKEGKPQMSNGIASTPEDTKEMFKQIIDDYLL